MTEKYPVLPDEDDYAKYPAPVAEDDDYAKYPAAPPAMTSTSCKMRSATVEG